MDNISKLSKDQIKQAIKLFKIKESDIISNDQAKKAYELYVGLHKKPNFENGPDKVRPNPNESFSVKYFKIPERITYLTRWVIKILPFIDLLSQVGNLPLQRTTDDFEGYIDEIFEKYLFALEDIYDEITEYNIIREIDLINVKVLSNEIKQSISEYYKGYPSEAYGVLEQVINSNLMSEGYLHSIMTIFDTIVEPLYKMRQGNDYVYSEEEMFHIPFNKRGLVSTNRYSIPGLPCVYLGSTPLTCWEELSKPNLDSVQTSLFIKKDVSYLDLSTPPKAIIGRLIEAHQANGTSENEMEKIYKHLTSYIVLWPLMAACSIRVKNAKDSFKPEYIFPQLLLQWIRRSDFDGVCYFSTKISNYTMETAGLYRNFAFPVQDSKKAEGYCSILKEKFDITDAVPWQVFQIYKGSSFAEPNKEAIKAEVELVQGMSLLYSNTDFSRLENFLIQKYEKKKNQ